MAAAAPQLLPPLWGVVLEYVPEYARPAHAQALPEFAAVYKPTTGHGLFRGIFVNFVNLAIENDDVPVLDWAIRRRYTTQLKICVGLHSDEWGFEVIKYMTARGAALGPGMFSSCVRRGDLRALQWLKLNGCPVGGGGGGPTDLGCAELCFELGYKPYSLSEACSNDLALFRHMFETYRVDCNLLIYLDKVSPEILGWMRSDASRIDLSHGEVQRLMLDSAADDESKAALAKRVETLINAVNTRGRDDLSVEEFGVLFAALARNDTHSLEIVRRSLHTAMTARRMASYYLGCAFRWGNDRTILDTFTRAIRDEKRELLTWLGAGCGAASRPPPNEAAIIDMIRVINEHGRRAPHVVHDAIVSISGTRVLDDMLDCLLRGDARVESVFACDDLQRVVTRFDELNVYECPIVDEFFARGGRASLDWLEKNYQIDPHKIMDLAVTYNNCEWFLWASDKKCDKPHMTEVVLREAWDVLDCMLKADPAAAPAAIADPDRLIPLMVRNAIQAYIEKK